MAQRDSSQWKNTISEENHLQVAARLIKAGAQGMHNPPQKKNKKHA
jgi:hypothetical protein